MSPHSGLERVRRPRSRPRRAVHGRDASSAVQWRDAVAATFPDLPPVVAIARNVVVIRTLQWITVRRARRLVDGSQHRWHSGVDDLQPFLLELSLNILTGPTTLTDEDLIGS